MGADKEKGAFLPHLIFLNTDPFHNLDCHNIEAFGPVSTIIPYNTPTCISWPAWAKVHWYAQ